VKGLPKAGARSLEAANQYLEQQYLPLWNERFTVKSSGQVDAHRPLAKDHRLASSLSHVETRVIGHDYTIRYGGQLYQVAREHIQPRLRGQAVRVERHLDGRLLVSAADGELTVCQCEKAERVAAPPIVRAKPAPAPPPGGRRRWMYGFRLDQPATPEIPTDGEEETCGRT
jgi:hypothetical protein